jgi:hypothetical protein
LQLAWRALAEQCALAWTRVYDTVGTIVQAIHDAAPAVCTAAGEQGAPADFANDFEKRLARRARRCLYVLGKHRG